MLIFMSFWNAFVNVELMDQRAQKPEILLDNVQLASKILTNSIWNIFCWVA